MSSQSQSLRFYHFGEMICIPDLRINSSLLTWSRYETFYIFGYVSGEIHRSCCRFVLLISMSRRHGVLLVNDDVPGKLVLHAALLLQVGSVQTSLVILSSNDIVPLYSFLNSHMMNLHWVSFTTEVLTFSFYGINFT